MKDWFASGLLIAVSAASAVVIYGIDCHNRVRFVDDKFQRAERWRVEAERAARCYRDEPDPCECMAVSGAPTYAVRCYERRGRAR